MAWYPAHKIIRNKLLDVIEEPNLFFLFNSVLRPFQDYFSSYETGQSVGGRKRENPRKTTWLTRKQNLACLTCGQGGAQTHTRHSGEMME